MLAMIGKTKLIIDQVKKTVEIRVSGSDVINDSFEEAVSKIKEKFPDYKMFATVDSRYKIDNLSLNELDKLAKHVGQSVKVLIKAVKIDEKKTRNGKFMYSITAELPGKRKFLQCKFFSKKTITLPEGIYYIVQGKINIGDPKYIKKNELVLGKEKDYQLMVSAIEPYEYITDEIKPLYREQRHELHAHTCFSKSDAFIESKDIRKAFLENKIDSIALTDHGNVMSFLPVVFDLKEEFKDSNKKIILGTEFYAVDYIEHQDNVYRSISNMEEELESTHEEETISTDITDIELNVKQCREEIKTFKKVAARKSSSAEDVDGAKSEIERLTNEISELTARMKELKAFTKEIAAKKVKVQKILEMTKKENIGTVNNVDRDHLIVLIKTEDEEIEYSDGTKMNINPGLVQLYKLISKSYLEYFSAPTEPEFKKWGKRPMLPYHELFEENVRKNFVVVSACAFGRHMKYAVAGEWDKFREWIKKLDAVEIQPLHNNIYMVEHEEYQNINSKEDVTALHREIYRICKEEGVPVIFTSDAHINDKEDRIFRSAFKEGYINSIMNRVKQSEINKKKKEAEKLGVEFEESEEEYEGSGDEDFSIERQPYILSYDEMYEDLKEQGFSDEEIEEIHSNTKKISDMCQNAFDMTLLPKKMFLPEFPGVDVKAEVPRLTWEFAVKKWSKDGTRDGIEPKIRERIETELDAIAKTGYEILYYVSYWACEESRKMGYDVGARGSCGSMVTTMALEIGENNPLEPHYFCESCRHIEWVDTELVGLDLPDKLCPECGSEMHGDGCNIEAHNFLGYRLEKTADLDLNFSDEVQADIHRKIIELFGEENVIKSGTQMFYQSNALKSNVFKHIPNIKERVRAEEFDIDYMANSIVTLSSTGSHPGGLLLKNQNIPFEYITPIVYVSDNNKKAERSSCWVYHTLEENLPKIDALAQGDPGMLKELQEMTGVPYRSIRFNNPVLYETVLDPSKIGIKDLEEYPFSSTTMGISEMNSDFTMGVLAEIRPTTMTDMIYFSGVTHGTGSWQGNVIREKVTEGEIKLQDGFPVRDIIYQHLTKKFGFDPAEAFTISESVRKGKGIKKWEKELRYKLPAWMVESMQQIKYAFPKSHALSYIMSALRIYHYKIYHKREFYVAALNRYGVGKNNNKNLDYIGMYMSINSRSDLERMHSHIDKASDNPAKIKDNQRIASIIWEMKLRGIKLEEAKFSSAPHKFSPSSKDDCTILMPLLSIKGIGDVGAENIAAAYKCYGDAMMDMNADELAELTIEKNGKTVKAFNKNLLKALF